MSFEGLTFQNMPPGHHMFMLKFFDSVISRFPVNVDQNGAILMICRTRDLYYFSNYNNSGISVNLAGFMVMPNDIQDPVLVLGEIKFNGNVFARGGVTLVKASFPVVQEMVPDGEVIGVEGAVLVHGACMVMNDALMVMEGMVSRL